MISEQTERSMATDQVSQLLQLQSNSSDESKMVFFSLKIVTIRSMKDALNYFSEIRYRGVKLMRLKQKNSRHISIPIDDNL